jgi:hypothetical protein
MISFLIAGHDNDCRRHAAKILAFYSGMHERTEEISFLGVSVLGRAFGCAFLILLQSWDNFSSTAARFKA